MSNNDEIQEMFMNQISSLKNQLEEEIKKHKLETDKLEKIIKYIYSIIYLMIQLQMT